MCDGDCSPGKTSRFFPLVPFHAFLFSLVARSLHKIIREEDENVFLVVCYVIAGTLGGLARAVVQSRELGAAGMSSFVRRWCDLLYLLCYLVAQHHAVADEIRPYEFSFNIVDFQHRFEKKDIEGLITGEYGFITADGVYHETGYRTDKNGDFIITRQRNRKITSLKDAQEIFKDRPEAAKKLIEAVMKACGGCKIPIKQEDNRPKPTESPLQKKMDPILKQMMKILTANTSKSFSEEKSKIIKKENVTKDITKSMVRAAKKLLSEEDKVDDRVLEKMANDLFYRFNYTITSHGHHEDGYRDGRKDGSYRSQNENGIDTQVRYLSNEFGHQPNVTFIPQTNAADEAHVLKGYSFRWYWS
ncbi:protein lethal(3)malignant blood neoplasm 1 isoform X2 [Pogonomyrmex barbatus]|uniref:Protein lethal(3)malignant blood neoplasm 1 isoform X2 n=1 Tax=Pogonomyrmex barbatus TaxID=144034 RepID=A0A6I9WP16_9HYME|nr:protein lethal(3)malignant blood neoplasm 1 isoform X2 [Pogonomyrmex barbatus]